VVSYGNGRILKLQEIGAAAESGYVSVPVGVLLKQNFPNPFNPSTTILYQISQPRFVNLRILTILGQEIQTLVEGNQEPGEHQVKWDANGRPSGIYVYQLRAGSSVETKSMLLLR
jgi:glucuronoarabinoxylan endo-1,4-beta-xylanase